MNWLSKDGRGAMCKVITECSFAELVEDPLVGLLMKSDGVDRRSIELLFERVARERTGNLGARDFGGGRSRQRGKESARCPNC
jgi:hypothetical protein